MCPQVRLRATDQIGWLRRKCPKWGTVNAIEPRSAAYTSPFLMRLSRAGDSEDGRRPSASATCAVDTGPSPRPAIARMYSRSAGVARSYRDPKNPTASSASAWGAAIFTSCAPIGLDVAMSQVTLPYAWTKYG